MFARAGADGKSILVSDTPEGAHPGAGAATGKIVNKDTQAKTDNVFVCDSSVLPTSPGMPPILTIVASARRLTKRLV